MHHIGIDIIEIARINKAVGRWGENFLHRIYTEPELELSRRKSSSLAVRFAGKEAVIKVLGKQAQGISWKEIEILAEPSGRPLVHLSSKAQNRPGGLGLGKLAISLSHSKEYAVAVVVGESK